VHDNEHAPEESEFQTEIDCHKWNRCVMEGIVLEVGNKL